MAVEGRMAPVWLLAPVIRTKWVVMGVAAPAVVPAPLIELSAATITQMHQQISQRLL